MVEETLEVVLKQHNLSQIVSYRANSPCYLFRYHIRSPYTFIKFIKFFLSLTHRLPYSVTSRAKNVLVSELCFLDNGHVGLGLFTAHRAAS